MEAPRRRPPYVATCVVLGLVLGWIPWFLHGPIPEKFNPHFIQGSITVWAYYVARLSIGLWVGISVWPRAWFLRGPLLGALALLPPGLFSWSVPECGPD